MLLLGAGPMAVTCVEVARRLNDHGIGVTVVDPRWVKPVDEAVIAAARAHRLVAVVEDNGRSGGFGDAVARLLRDDDVDTPVKTFGLAPGVPRPRHPGRDPRGGRADPAAPGPPAHRGGRPAHPGARPTPADRPWGQSSTQERLPE